MDYLHQQAVDKLGRGPLRRSSDLHGEEGMPGVGTNKGGWGPPVLEVTGCDWSQQRALPTVRSKQDTKGKKDLQLYRLKCNNIGK